MANEHNVKQVSRLTGALLARKGAAAPSPASALFNQQAINRFPAMPQETVHQEPVPQAAAPQQAAVARDYSVAPEREDVRVAHSLNDNLNDNLNYNQGNQEKAPQIIMKEKDSETPVNISADTGVDMGVNLGRMAAKERKVSIKKSKSIKSPHDASAKKRIAMTLRMEEDIHLNLRIFSAHTRKSCQVILSEALDLYLAEHSDKVPSQRVASHNR